MHNVELATTQTTHLFDGRQTWGQMWIEALCGRKFRHGNGLAFGRGEPVCQRCVEAELKELT